MGGFDAAAGTYDTDFTNTFIGKTQRQRVWRYLDRQIASGMKVLELNGGTGADAQHLVAKGCKVLFTDISAEMLEIARSKIGNAASYREMDLKDLDKIDLANQFDLIFSNFGGLNCISKNGLTVLNTFASRHLAKNGKLILVIMPTRNIIDSLYRKWKKVPKPTRESHVPTRILVADEMVDTYFHDPADVEKQMSDFKKIRSIPVGFIPSYFVAFLSSRPFLRVLLIWIDRFLALFSGLSGRGDHYLIHMERR